MSYEERKHAAKIGEKKPCISEREGLHRQERHHVKRYTHILVRRLHLHDQVQDQKEADEA